MLAPALRERLPDWSLYAVRTLALLRGVDVADDGAALSLPTTVELPTSGGEW